MLFKVLEAIFLTFFLFGLGAWAFWKKYILPDDLGRWGKLAIDILFPFCAFAGVVKGFDADQRHLVWIPPVIGFGIILWNMLLGLVLQKFLHDDSSTRRRTFRHMATVNNYMYLPLIIVANTYDAAGVGTLMLMSLGSAAGLWSLGIIVMAGPGEWRTGLKNLLSPNMIAVILALFFVLTEIRVPGVVITISQGVGTVATPLALILIGASLCNTGSKLWSNWRDATWCVVCRLIILPVLTIPLLKYAALPEFIYQVALIVALMPASCASVLIVRKYGGCPDFAGQTVFFTTLLSPVTIMLFLWYLA